MTLRRRLRARSVHPHGRGDNDVVAGVRVKQLGSPPRAWGQYWLGGIADYTRRFTPTGVGTMRHVARLLQTGDGSPPRAWGQWAGDEGRKVKVRFTPTGVGTITPSPRGTACRPVHPHGRGDNLSSGAGWWTVLGSPPRAWGQSPCHKHDENSQRFTPTGVGTMSTGRRVCTAHSVHPHGRGDNRGPLRPGRAVCGSPPRAWGQ